MKNYIDIDIDIDKLFIFICVLFISLKICCVYKMVVDST
jgi:hypothetical protein